MARDAADVRRELVPGESFDEWLRCARCGTPSSSFRDATDEDLPEGDMSPIIYECVLQ